LIATKRGGTPAIRHFFIKRAVFSPWKHHFGNDNGQNVSALARSQEVFEFDP
jgi:hypothetical protein